MSKSSTHQSREYTLDTTTLDAPVEEIAQAQADIDAALLADLKDRDGEITDATVEDQPEPTLADRVIGAANLIVGLRKSTRLQEETLAKLFETGLQWHAWDWQRRMQEAQQAMSNPFSQYVQGNGEENNSTEEGLVGPDPDEYLGAAEDEFPTPTIVPTDAE